MDAKLDEHLDYQKSAVEGKDPGNSRNDYSFKSLKVDFGEVEISTPRYRNSTDRVRFLRITAFFLLPFYAKFNCLGECASSFFSLSREGKNIP